MTGGKKRNNYFSDNIQKNGEGFLQQYDAKKLRNDARRVFLDIAHCNIDFDKYWMYFTEPMFIDALIDVASSKKIIHGTSYNALDACSRDSYDPNVETVKRYHRRLFELYSLFYEYIYAVKASGFSGESISNLKILSNKAREYAADMNDPIFGSVNIVGDSYAYSPSKFVEWMNRGVPQPTVINSIPAVDDEPVKLSFNSLIKEDEQ